MRDLHPSGITRVPPTHASPALPDLPEPTVCGDRIAWPSILEYGVIQDDGCEAVAWVPPTERAERKPSVPDASPAYRQPRTLAYRVIVHDLARYERLKFEGFLRDPCHTGGAILQEP